jgi:hypothetical protein
VRSIWPKLLTAAATVAAVGLLVDLMTDGRWLDVVLVLLVGALLEGGATRSTRGPDASSSTSPLRPPSTATPGPEVA